MTIVITPNGWKLIGSNLIGVTKMTTIPLVSDVHIFIEKQLNGLKLKIYGLSDEERKHNISINDILFSPQLTIDDLVVYDISLRDLTTILDVVPLK